MRQLTHIAMLAALASTAPLAAQDRSAGADFRNGSRDFWHVASGPGHASGADLRTAGLLAAGAGATLLLLDEPIHQWLHGDPVVSTILGPFREHSPVSLIGRTWVFLLPLSAGRYGAGHAFDSIDLRDAGAGCLTANLTTTLTRSAASLLVGRLRPRTEKGPFAFELFAFGDWDQRSFPGGHAANIMSCAAFWNHRFDLGIAGPSIYALATGVGLARMVDEAHWASDSFVGMSYGYAVGRNVAERFLVRLDPVQPERSLQPGIVVGGKITF
jgi:membrane-associated phospholipid phosphatase